MIDIWVCVECGHLFGAPKKCYGEQLEYFGTPCREEWDGCPNCGGAYSEAYKCELCDEFIAEDYFKDENGNRYCETHFTLTNLGDETF